MLAHDQHSVVTPHRIASAISHSVGQAHTLACGAMPHDVPLLPLSEHRKTVGAWLRRLLDAMDIAYVDAAEDMGTTKHSLNDWMAGRHYPSIYALYRFGRVHNIRAYDYALGGDWSLLPSWLADRLKPDFSGMPPFSSHDDDASAGQSPAAAPEPDPADGGKRGRRKRRAHHTP